MISFKGGQARPIALAAGILADGNRIFFLQKKRRDGMVELELPSCKVLAGENPVACLAKAFKAQAGIDVEVGQIAFQSKYNSGSRKHRRTVPALAFSCHAKNASARISGEFAGFKWLQKGTLLRERLSRNAAWAREIL